MENFEVIISACMNVKKLNNRGVRKGSSNYAAAGNTFYPYLSSILVHAEWSIGKTMEVHFQFEEFRDAYLGRSLAGLDPNTEEIAILSTYFTERIENYTTISALHLTFGEVCNRNSNQISLSLLLLGSVVYHSCFKRCNWE